MAGTPQEPILAPHDNAYLMLAYGRLEDGITPYWCYVAVPAPKYQEFMDRLKAGKLDLSKVQEEGLGQVIVSGKGETPPPQVTKEIARAAKIPLKDLFKDVKPE